MGSYPVDVMASCDHLRGDIFAVVEANGATIGDMTCQDPPQLMGCQCVQVRRPSSRSWVPARTGNIDVSIIGADAIADRLQVTIRSPGTQAEETLCKPWTPGQPPPEQTAIGGRVSVPLTLIFRIQAPRVKTAADYAKRVASWPIAVYEEQS